MLFQLESALIVLRCFERGTANEPVTHHFTKATMGMVVAQTMGVHAGAGAAATTVEALTVQLFSQSPFS